MKPLQRILHVEDDISIQEVTKLALEVVGGLEITSGSRIWFCSMS